MYKLKQFIISIGFQYYISKVSEGKIIYYYIKNNYLYEIYIWDSDMMILYKTDVGYNYKFDIKDFSKLSKSVSIIQTRVSNEMLEYLFKLFKNEVRLLKLKKVLV